MNIVSIESVHKNYRLGKTEVPALRDVSLFIEKGDFVSIIGPSGSGKSTMLNIIGCIDVPSSGSVSVCGRETQKLSDRELTDLRGAAIGFIFQSFNLLPILSVYENIEFPLLLGKKKNQAEKRRERDYILQLIDEVGLTKWKKHKPNELSGGQRQRVAIARALAVHPQLVLADEPTANLDSKTGEEIISLMKRINAEMQTTFIFSTHDKNIFSIANHVVELRDGKIIKNERLAG